MNMTFKAFLLKAWTVTDDRILYKNKELLLSSLERVEHSPVKDETSNGVLTVFWNDGLRFANFAYPYSQREDAKKAIEHILRVVHGEDAVIADKKQIQITEKGFRKKCNVCGHIYCYTINDLKKNKELERDGLLNSMSAFAGGLSGFYGASATSLQSSNDLKARIIDYNKCPSCGSRDLTDITDEELEQVKQQQTVAISCADELKKFKELLDSGVVTQEEFDAKKKQLLGL